MNGCSSASPTSKIVTVYGASGKPRGGESLVLEPPLDVFVVRVTLGEQLDRDRPAQRRVRRAVDVAHAASGEVRDVRVAPREDVAPNRHDKHLPQNGLVKTL